VVVVVLLLLLLPLPPPPPLPHLCEWYSEVLLFGDINGACGSSGGSRDGRELGLEAGEVFLGHRIVSQVILLHEFGAFTCSSGSGGGGGGGVERYEEGRGGGGRRRRRVSWDHTYDEGGFTSSSSRLPSPPSSSPGFQPLQSVPE